MKKIRILYLLLVLPTFLFAQNREITGVVFDENNEPLPGASIVVKKTTIGASTDFDGVFTIKIPDGNNTIVVSYMGYISKEISIGNQDKYTVNLELDANTLDEIVVVGYGTMRKSDITGSVTSIKVDETAAQQNSTVDQLLQGRAAGVQVIQNGTPGSGVSVRIRGANSLRGNNEPLYVVDGVIISSAGEDAQGAGGGNEQQESQNGLNGINPRDIEHMEVLKDASATAIYGSRGANGVILITTKKGKNGKTSISGYLTSSISEINNRIDVLNGVDFAKYQNESNLVNGNGPKYEINGGQVYPITYNDSKATISDTAMNQVNWHDEIYKQGLSTSAGVSFSGGDDKGNYYVSTGFSNQGGIVDNSKLQSGNFSINLSQNMSDRFKIDAKMSAFMADGNFAQDGNRAGGDKSFIGNVVRYSPLVDENGGSLEDEDGISGPYTWINDFEDVSNESRFIGSLALTYSFKVKGLKYKLQAGGNMRNKERRRFYGLTTAQGKQSNGVLSMSDLNSTSYQINNLLTYNRAFKQKHRINALVGVTYDVRDSNNELYEVSDFSTTEFTYHKPSYGQLITRPLEIIYLKSQLLSFLSRVNYSYDDRYILTGTFRADGSSKFSKENRFSYFPSFSFAWRAVNESFLADSNSVSELKLRLGWGTTGNQGISPYQTYANYGPTLYATLSEGTGVGFVPLNIGNNDLKWETTKQYNVGVDFGFWNNRLTGTIDAYEKQTDDLLQLENLPGSTGFRSLLINRGSINNKGIELSLNGVLVEKEDFNLEIGGNIAYNKSKIQKLGIPESPIYINGELEERSYYLGDNISTGSFFKSPANIFIEGEEMGLFYGYETDGIYQEGDDITVADMQPGDVKIIDQNGDGEITLLDRTFIGNPNPDFVYGGFVTMNYKRLSVNVLMNGVSGNDIVNGNLLRIGVASGNATNVSPAAYHDAWRADAPSNSYPRIGYNKDNGAAAITDRIIEDGSYFRLSNVTIGYDLPVEDSNVFSRVNMYVSGINLLTVTGYSGYNPEITNFMNNGNIIGVDWNGLPNSRTFMLGLNLNF